MIIVYITPNFKDIELIGDAGAYSKQCSRTANRKLTRPAESKLKIPCKRNLLCHKADQHVGGCVYAKNRNNKVQY